MDGSSFAAPPPSDVQISNRQLRWGLWVARNRTRLRRGGIAALIIIAVVSWGYTLWGLADYYYVRGDAFARSIAASASRTHPQGAVVARRAPAPIAIAETLLIPTGSDRYDVAARLVNANARWAAVATVVFEVPGADTHSERFAVLPSSDRWVIHINAQSDMRPTAAAVTIRSVDWDYLSALQTSDVARYVAERVAFRISDARFQSFDALPGDTRGPQVSRATFTVTNAGAYGARRVELAVLLERNGAVVGVNRTVLDDLLAGETRSVAATWFHSVGLITAVRVFPTLDIFAPQAFLPPLPEEGSAP